LQVGQVLSVFFQYCPATQFLLHSTPAVKVYPARQAEQVFQLPPVQRLHTVDKQERQEPEEIYFPAAQVTQFVLKAPLHVKQET
jgi:hypothetical protein